MNINDIVFKNTDYGSDIFYKDIYIEEIDFEGKEKYKQPKDDVLVEPMFKPKPIDMTENYSIEDVSTPKESFKLPDNIWDKHDEEDSDVVIE